MADNFLLTPFFTETKSFVHENVDDDDVQKKKNSVRKKCELKRSRGSFWDKPWGVTVKEIIFYSDKFYKPDRGKRRSRKNRKPPRRRRIRSFLWKNDRDWNEKLKNVFFSSEEVGDGKCCDTKLFLNNERKLFENENKMYDLSGGQNDKVSDSSLPPLPLPDPMEFISIYREVCFDGNLKKTNDTTIDCF